MSTIKFTVEDSKAAGILKVVLNSGITVNDIEVTGAQRLRTEENSASCIIQSQPSSAVNYDRSKSTPTIMPADAEFVGGTIFYIDDTADGVYEFLDVHGKVIENVQVGDRPYYYRVLKKGSKDKYYVYHDEVYDNLRWTYCKEDSYVYESLDTSGDRGLGKTNTKIVMAKDNGAYITSDSNGIPTIWYKLQQVRDARVAGCNDWFIPSAYEVNELRTAVKSGSITRGTIAEYSYWDSVFANKWIWSSSDSFAQNSWLWNGYSQYWHYYGKDSTYSVFFTRAF